MVRYLALTNIHSWGYLFQMALLEVSSVRSSGGFWTDTSPLSFLQSGLYADLYSYSALMLANNNGSSLLDAELLTKTSQYVFSNFFQWFISLPNDYDGYWAYQSVGTEPEPGLRPPRVTTWTETATYTAEVNIPSYSPDRTTTASLLGAEFTTFTYTDEVTITLDGESPTSTSPGTSSAASSVTSPSITQKLRLRDTTKKIKKELLCHISHDI
jgi:hypothetical protein